MNPITKNVCTGTGLLNHCRNLTSSIDRQKDAKHNSTGFRERSNGSLHVLPTKKYILAFPEESALGRGGISAVAQKFDKDSGW